MPIILTSDMANQRYSMANRASYFMLPPSLKTIKKLPIQAILNRTLPTIAC